MKEKFDANAKRDDATVASQTYEKNRGIIKQVQRCTNHLNANALK